MGSMEDVIFPQKFGFLIKEQCGKCLACSSSGLSPDSQWLRIPWQKAHWTYKMKFKNNKKWMSEIINKIF